MSIVYFFILITNSLSINKNFEMFTKIYDIYKLENPDDVPYSQSLPVSVKLAE